MSVRSNSKQRARRVVFLRERDGENCWICGERMLFLEPRRPHGRLATIDHVVPLYEGGTNGIENVRLAHQLCNTIRRRGQSDPRGNPDHRFYVRGRRHHPTRYWEMFKEEYNP